MYIYQTKYKADIWALGRLFTKYTFITQGHRIWEFQETIAQSLIWKTSKYQIDSILHALFPWSRLGSRVTSNLREVTHKS